MFKTNVVVFLGHAALAQSVVATHVPAGLELRCEVVAGADHLWREARDAVGAGAEGLGVHVGDAGAVAAD